MEIVEVPIKEIKPYEKNSKKHPKEQIKKIADSIKVYGFNVPILLDKNKVIIAGHGRYEASKLLGLENVPCIFLENLTEEQIKAYRIMDNKSAESDWDIDFLKEELDFLKGVGYDINLTGFTEDELNELFPSVDDDKELVDVEPETTETIETDIKPGDIIILGNHRLMCGDATNSKDINLLLDKKVEMAFTSPPYNVGHNLGYEKNSKYLHDNDNKDNYLDFLIKSTNLMLNNARYVFINLQFLQNNKHNIINYLYNYNDFFVDIAFWKKLQVAPSLAKNVMNSQVECIFIFSKEKQTRSIDIANFKGNVSNIVETNSASFENNYSNIHNATFPIEFVSYFIKNFTKKEASILDVFGGTGTTLIACEQLNRRCYMMEIEPEYCEIICRRWEKLTGKKRKKLSSSMN